ncbi:hypothetical protein WMY93_027092 [Mugilogobius chulae]|uniref:ribonuclease H n=1 Tax=Mugilogobius chulae TaxID=88201 RepID=A0AAW0N473_9GOBI
MGKNCSHNFEHAAESRRETIQLPSAPAADVEHRRQARGVAASDIDKHLLKQFCRGCWDNEMISKLQLEHKKDNPPAFSELLLLLRTEEDRQQAKESLMKQHISSSKQRATLHSQSACSCTHDSSTTSINELKKQMEKLQQQMSTLLAQISPTSKTGKCSSASLSNRLSPRTLDQDQGFASSATQMNREDHHGVVKLNSATPQIIPAGQTILLEGIAVAHSLQTERAVMVEHPTSFHLPGGLMIQSCLVDFSSQHPVLLPVPVTNETDHDVILPACALLAEISAFQSVSCASQSTPESTSTTLSEPLFDYNFGDSPLTPEWKSRIIQNLNSIPEVFARNDLDFGRTDKVKHQIKLLDPTPFKQRPRPIHPQDLDAVRKHLHELLESGVIRESDSPFASPIVVVRKKNGSVRLCIDYRKLNLQTIKDAYALPKLEDTFTALTGSQWFSVLDLKSGYYQIEMDEQDKNKTAFVCPLGFWEFNRMPQGVTNAPSTFQRLMEKCVGEMNLKEVLVFIDDLIVFAPTLEQHEERLMRVLNRLKEFGLKLSVEKCTFFQTSVRYLDILCRKTALKLIQTKRFVEGYSHIVKPLHELTAGYPPSHKKLKPLVNPAQYLNPKEPFGGRWTVACQEAFETIKEKLTSAPVLAFADPKKPYLLHTDASATGLGAVLYQEQEGQKRVIAYASRGLSRSESRYPAHKLEFLALKWAVTENSPTRRNKLPLVVCTLNILLQNHYRAGRQNTDADALSRRPHGNLTSDLLSEKEKERIIRFAEHHLDTPNVITIDQHTVQALSDRHLICSAPDQTPDHTLVHSLSMSADSLPDSFTADEQFASSVVSPLSPADIADKQRADPVLGHVIAQLETGDYLHPLLHDQMGHMGIERTLDLVRNRFYWPRMANDVQTKLEPLGVRPEAQGQLEKSYQLAAENAEKIMLKNKTSDSSDSETNLPPETPTSDVEQPRKSTRDRRPPDRLQYSHLAAVRSYPFLMDSAKFCHSPYQMETLLLRLAPLASHLEVVSPAHRNQTSTATDMSSTRDRSSEETFMCSICLELFSEPVSTPCGHNFCKRCISEAWDTAGSCTCPVCKEVFSSRPELKVNTLLQELVSQDKIKALKSCLVCLSSFCETHLQPHLTVSGLKKHQLMEPVENLEDRLCPEHQRPMELFCDTDEKIVCMKCIPLEHKSHELLSLEEACERRKSSLLHTQAHTQHMVEQRRLKLEEIQRCLELSDTEVHRERAEGLQVFTALMQSVQRRQELFLEELQEKQKLSHKRAQELVQQLEQEICELQKSRTEAEELSRSQDPLHFLQHCPALTGLKDWSSVSFEGETFLYFYDSVQPFSLCFHQNRNFSLRLLKDTSAESNLHSHREKTVTTKNDETLRLETNQPNDAKRGKGDKREPFKHCFFVNTRRRTLDDGGGEHSTAANTQRRRTLNGGEHSTTAKPQRRRTRDDGEHAAAANTRRRQNRNGGEHAAATTTRRRPRGGDHAAPTTDMSSTRDRSSEETFMCSICLELFSEPVSTPCGHNFCKRCISEAWDTAGSCTCPVCNEVFCIRPELKVNTLLQELMLKDKIKVKRSNSMGVRPSFTEVQCDVCSEPKLKALKSCLVCLSSFCETHLQRHLTVSGLKKHQLMEPVENLEDRLCPEHQRPLELFCNTDEKIVCMKCIPLEHKSHDLLSLEEACERRRSSLQQTQAHTQHMVEQRRLKLEEIQRCLELSDTEVHRERAEGLQVFTALMQSVQRRQELFLEELQEKQKLSHKRAQELVQQLEQEICELQKSSTEAEELSCSQDHLHFLQHCLALTGLKDWSSVSFKGERCEGSVARVLKELSKELLSESNTAELKRVQEFAVDVTLDPDTANPWLIVSKDLKRVRETDKEQIVRNSRLRFTEDSIVLGKQSFSSGRFYFEAQVKGRTHWELGVAKESVERKKYTKRSPEGGFWCISMNDPDKYFACTDPKTDLSPSAAPQKVGVFVDYDQGLVSFYDSDSADLLFSFTGCCFTEKLFPYFYPGWNLNDSNPAPLVITAVETFTEAK